MDASPHLPSLYSIRSMWSVKCCPNPSFDSSGFAFGDGFRSIFMTGTALLQATLPQRPRDVTATWPGGDDGARAEMEADPRAAGAWAAWARLCEQGSWPCAGLASA